MSVSTTPQHRYSFDNNDIEAVDRHNYLNEMLDNSTIDRLSELGDLRGRSFLEIGAGSGSIARWMADQAGPDGLVVATDINTRHIRPYPGLTVLRHDIVNEPVPDGPWDVIHARLVLLHLPQREDVLQRLAKSLAPGGVLFLEEWQTSYRSLVLAAPDPESAALLELYQELLVGTVLPAKGNDPTWASRAHAAMLEAGLTGVDTSISSRSWPGGSAGALLIAANLGQLREEFLEAGLTVGQFDDICKLVADPRIVLRGHFLYSTVGRAPA